MKDFVELSEVDCKPYVLRNQAVSFSLGYNPRLSLKVKRGYLVDGRFFGLISTGGVFHMITERSAFNVGVSYSVARKKLNQYIAEQPIS